VDPERDNALALLAEVTEYRNQFLLLGRDLTQDPFGRAEAIFDLVSMYVERGMYTEAMPGLGQARTAYRSFLAAAN
jgi:hypothetical protein